MELDEMLEIAEENAAADDLIWIAYVDHLKTCDPACFCPICERERHLLEPA